MPFGDCLSLRLVRQQSDRFEDEVLAEMLPPLVRSAKSIPVIGEPAVAVIAVPLVGSQPLQSMLS